MDDTTRNAVKEQLSQIAELTDLQEMEDIVCGVAKLTFAYYRTLCNEGMNPEHAALVTAHYSAHINDIGNK